MTSAKAADAKRSTELRPGFFGRFAQAHARVIIFTLGQFWRNLGGAFLTCFVIGITLALPATLHCVVKNINAVSYSWESTLQASLFLKDSVSAQQGQLLAAKIGHYNDVAVTSYISREQSLSEFKTLSGFSQALDLLDSNPLPAVITIVPVRGIERQRLDALVTQLGKLPEVEVAKLDREWLERLYAVLALVERLVLVIAGVLGLAVVVIVGNTVRLDIEAKRVEIEVMKLIGATDGFIRRPFLYTGLWYGLIGGVIGWLLVFGAVWALSSPAQTLSDLYASDYQLKGLSWDATLVMFASGIVLGGLGAWWTVARRLREIEPK